MKNIFSIIFTLFFFTFISAQNWVQKADFGGEKREGAVSFVLGGKAYAGLGKDGSTYFNDFWEYDPAADTWTQMEDFPGVARAYSVAFVLNGKAYVGMGEIINSSGNIGFMPDFYEFDDSDNSWEQISNFGALARSRAVSFVIGDKAYVGTGNSNSGAQRGFQSFDGSDWAQVANTERWRSNAVGFSLNGKGYVSGGSQGANFFSDVVEYDPLTDSWTEKIFADFAFNHIGAIAFTIGGKAFLGYGGNERFTEYDPATNTFTSLGDVLGLDAERTSGIAFVVGNTGYLGLGCGDPGFGCVNRKDVWAMDFPSPANEVFAQKFKVVPTFPKDGFSVFSQQSVTGMGVSLIDPLGRAVRNWKNVATNDWLQIAGLPPNNYFVQITIGGRSYIERLYLTN